MFGRLIRFNTGDLIVVPPGGGPTVGSRNDRVREAIAEGMQSLTDREREIVSSHFGLGGEGGTLTLDQLGQRFGVTKERIRQIEKRALESGTSASIRAQSSMCDFASERTSSTW